jgi:hypothetical protein
MFGFLVSGLMSLIVSGIATMRAIRWDVGFGESWMNAWIISWAIAFPTILIVSPIVRRFVAAITKQPS